MALSTSRAEAVVHRGRRPGGRPRWITASEPDLHNSSNTETVVSLFIQNISKFVTSLPIRRLS